MFTLLKNKNLSFVYFFAVLSFLVGSIIPAVVFGDEKSSRAAEAVSIAGEIGISPDPWFSNSAQTMSTLKQGLLEIDNQSKSLAEKGVSQSVISAQRTESISALKEYAKATNKIENINGLNQYLQSDATIEAKKADLFKKQSDFNKTINSGYEKSGLTKEAEIYKNSSKELDALAAEHSEKSVPKEGNTFADNSAFAAFNPQGKVYELLAPIETFFPGGKIDIAGGGLGTYLNGLYKAGIAAATGLALIMIVIGGLQYVSTDAIGGKSEGRERIKNAVVGLLLALGSYLLLQQINPALLKNDFNLEATKSVGKVAEVDVELSDGKVNPKYVEGSSVGGGTDGGVSSAYIPTQFNNSGVGVNGPVRFAMTPGSKVIGGGPVAIDYDGSPGAYKVAQSPSGKYTFRGVRYNSVGYEDLANAGVPGNWWGVQTGPDKQPIINGDGTMIPILSIGAGKINGDVVAFVALSAGQVAAAKKYGVTLKPSLNTDIILSANGKSIHSVYADYAGNRGGSYSEISPGAAKALGIDFGKKNGRSYAVGNVTISLP